MVASPIFGGFYRSRSLNLADNECMNLYPEIVEDKSGKQIGALYGAPGLTLWKTIGNGPIRGFNVWHGSSGDVLFVVSGGQLYSVSLSGVVTALGGVPNVATGLPSAVVWNTSTSTLSSVALPFSPTVQVPTLRPSLTNNGEGNQIMIGFGLSLVFQDGFGLMNQPGTPTLWQSNILDLSKWNALNFGQATGDSDNIQNLIQIRREIFCIKDGHIQLFINEGNPGFVFGVLDGVYEQVGTSSPYSWVKTGSQLIGLSQTTDQNTGSVSPF